MAAKNTVLHLDGMTGTFQEIHEMLISMNKMLDLMSQRHEEAAMKKMSRESTSVTEVDLTGDGNESDLSNMVEDEPDLVDEEIKVSLSDVDDVATKPLGDEESKPDLTSTDGFKIELTPSILTEEVVSETCVFGDAKNNQFGAIMNYGQIVNQISTILTEPLRHHPCRPQQRRRRRRRRRPPS